MAIVNNSFEFLFNGIFDKRVNKTKFWMQCDSSCRFNDEAGEIQLAFTII